MQKCTDFDRKMLLLATQVAHKEQLRLVLLAVLNHLLRTLKFGSPSSSGFGGTSSLGSNATTAGEVLSEGMTLLRCLIKLILGMLGPTKKGDGKGAVGTVAELSREKRLEMIERMVEYFRTSAFLFLYYLLIPRREVSEVNADNPSPPIQPRSLRRLRKSRAQLT